MSVVVEAFETAVVPERGTGWCAGFSVLHGDACGRLPGHPGLAEETTPPATSGLRHSDSQPSPEPHLTAQGDTGRVAVTSSHGGAA